MDDIPKVRRAVIDTTDGQSVLRMHTLEGIEVSFDLDDMALVTIGLSVNIALEQSLERDLRVFGFKES